MALFQAIKFKLRLNFGTGLGHAYIDYQGGSGSIIRNYDQPLAIEAVVENFT